MISSPLQFFVESRIITEKLSSSMAVYLQRLKQCSGRTKEEPIDITGEAKEQKSTSGLN